MEEEDSSSLYSVLGVGRTASASEISSAYRRLSRTYHPDRRLDVDEKAAAGPHWLKISAAYDVLADDKRRMVYDELGGGNLVEGLALIQSKKIGSSISTAEDLHREWRRSKSRNAEASEMGRMGASGSIVLSASLQPLLQPADRNARLPLWRRMKPELSSVAMSEEMRLSCTCHSNPIAFTTAPEGVQPHRHVARPSQAARVRISLALSGSPPLRLHLQPDRDQAGARRQHPSCRFQTRPLSSLLVTDRLLAGPQPICHRCRRHPKALNPLLRHRLCQHLCIWHCRTHLPAVSQSDTPRPG